MKMLFKIVETVKKLCAIIDKLVFVLMYVEQMKLKCIFRK